MTTAEESLKSSPPGCSGDPSQWLEYMLVHFRKQKKFQIQWESGELQLHLYGSTPVYLCLFGANSAHALLRLKGNLTDLNFHPVLAFHR